MIPYLQVYDNIQILCNSSKLSIQEEIKEKVENIFQEVGGHLLKVATKLIGPFPVTAAWIPKMRKATIARRACLISAN